MYLINIPEPVQYDIYTLQAFPFDLRCESVTYNIICMQTFMYFNTFVATTGAICDDHGLSFTSQDGVGKGAVSYYLNQKLPWL